MKPIHRIAASVRPAPHSSRQEIPVASMTAYTLLRNHITFIRELPQCHAVSLERSVTHLRLPCSLSYSFYTINEVIKFQYSRPIRKGEKDPDNEFAVSTGSVYTWVME